MPAKSKEQQSAFALALAARRGDVSPESLTGAARQLFKDDSLTQEQLKDYAKTKRSEHPKRAGQKPHTRFKTT